MQTSILSPFCWWAGGYRVSLATVGSVHSECSICDGSGTRVLLGKVRFRGLLQASRWEMALLSPGEMKENKQSECWAGITLCGPHHPSNQGKVRESKELGLPGFLAACVFIHETTPEPFSFWDPVGWWDRKYVSFQMLYSFTWKLRKSLSVLKWAKQVKILVHEFSPNILKTSDGEKKLFLYL